MFKHFINYIGMLILSYKRLTVNHFFTNIIQLLPVLSILSDAGEKSTQIERKMNGKSISRC